MRYTISARTVPVGPGFGHTPGHYSTGATQRRPTDDRRAWYHGSPFRLISIRAGSTLTQDRDLARVFSHKPRFVVQNEDDSGRRTIKHSGALPGFLYQITEEIGPDDITPHPHTAMGPGQEWLTRRDLEVMLVGATEIAPHERLTAAEVDALKRRLPAEER